MKIIVLGAGLVGSPMAVDLAKDNKFEVSIADISSKNLENIPSGFPIRKICKDLSQPADVTALVKDYDMVINAVPGFMGYKTLEAIIEAGKNVIDIAFFPEDPFSLNQLAKEKGVVSISDIGVAPGMSNLLIGHVDTLLDKTETIKIYVGGLPKVREWPFEYKAVFSPVDVIEEYTRPARYIENGHLVVRPALSDPEFLSFDKIGTLEAFNSDGLRSLAETIDAKNMIEKTLRYQGHIEKMAVLRETGFFDKEEININGVMISPLDFTSKILFPKWKMEEGEVDVTVMQVVVEGTKDGQALRYTYDLYDEYDPETKVHSMARTTGYTATVAARMVAEGLYKEVGVSVPEFVGKDKKCVDFILKGLEERNISYKEKIEKI